MWSLITDGEVNYRLEDGPLRRAGAGDLLLIPKGVVHYVILSSSEAMMVNVHFRAFVYETVDMITLLGLSGRFEADTLLRELTFRLCGEFAGDRPGRERILSDALRLCLALLIRRAPRSVWPAMTAPLNGIVRLQPALTYIEEAFRRPDLRIIEIARILHVSAVYCRRLFRRVLGRGPLQYIRQRRVHAAAAELLETGNSVQEIAHRCGFSDPYFFNRTFRQLMGIPPGEFRRRGRF